MSNFEVRSPLSKQITNRNFLLATGFKFSLGKYPKIDFFSNTASIPSVNLGVAIQPTYLKDIPIPGDKLTYDDFSLEFLVDEQLENYISIHQWLTGYGYPDSVRQYQNLLDDDELSPGKQYSESGQSDGTLLVYNSNFNPVIKVKFTGLFPVSLSTISFDSKDQNSTYVTASVTFKYTNYIIEKVEA
jgi:hypothetical protein